MADLTDRHFALFGNNQHPIQLAVYKEYNSFLQSMHSVERTQRGAASGEDMQMMLAEANSKLNTAEGESLSIEELQDIYFQVKSRARERRNMSLNTRTKTG